MRRSIATPWRFLHMDSLESDTTMLVLRGTEIGCRAKRHKEENSVRYEMEHTLAPFNVQFHARADNQIGIPVALSPDLCPARIMWGHTDPLLSDRSRKSHPPTSDLRAG